MNSQSDIPIHPAAAMFPELQGEEFEALVKDIKEHGQREPIVLLDGMILDGRNRYRAVMSLFLKPKFVEWDGEGTPEQFVISKNIMRRHLTEVQRAMIGAKLLTLKSGQRGDYAGVNTFTPVITSYKAAEISGVSRDSIMSAKLIQEKGTLEQVAAVEAGRKGLRTTAVEIRATKNGNPDERREKAIKKHTRTKRIMSNYWKDFKTGVDLLAGMPDVESAINAIPAQHGSVVTKRVPAIIKWLTEFQEKWNDSHRHKD